jgi:hypothetical protein
VFIASVLVLLKMLAIGVLLVSVQRRWTWQPDSAYGSTVGADRPLVDLTFTWWRFATPCSCGIASIAAGSSDARQWSCDDARAGVRSAPDLGPCE